MRALVLLVFLACVFLPACSSSTKKYDYLERGKQIRKEQAQRDWEYNQRKERYEK